RHSQTASMQTLADSSIKKAAYVTGELRPIEISASPALIAEQANPLEKVPPQDRPHRPASTVACWLGVAGILFSSFRPA
ncbi:hypothetical protein OAH22_03025, partial [bacterium]|nr:hypothetical protein [bacterium]